ncbi:MAG: hypothetical protein R3E57_00155 [Porticoccaceae bacterium]
MKQKYKVQQIKLNQKNNFSYKKIMFRRKVIIWSMLCVPMALCVLSFFIGEDLVFVVFSGYIIGMMFYTIWVHISSVCPSCGGPFFAVSCDFSGRARFKISYLSKSCNQCGYKGETIKEGGDN